MSSTIKREVWVDNVKVIACILVVFGHFFQSMLKSGLMQDYIIYQWFNTTIYYFHVPLFFFCSGYLFQKYSKIDSFMDWSENVIKKLIALGVPYFAFSTITWILKKVFSSSINTELGSLVDTLFINPTSPYWYLYILFIFFLISVTAKSKREMIVFLVLSIICKVATISGFYANIYCIDKSLSNWFWFVIGMAFAYGIIKVVNKTISIALLILFILLSIVFYFENIFFWGSEYVLGMLACYSIVCIIYNAFKSGKQNCFFANTAKYTMPVFLMHTIFAAPLRSILIKSGITNLAINIAIGLAISFLGPILAIVIMEKIKPLDFIIYPMKYIRFVKKNK